MLNLTRGAAAAAARVAINRQTTRRGGLYPAWCISRAAAATAAATSTGAGGRGFHTTGAVTGAGSRPLPPRIKIDEGEIVENFLKGSGPGGQKIVSPWAHSGRLKEWMYCGRKAARW